jgi:cob(I)alamin adenosyltransferase
MTPPDEGQERAEVKGPAEGQERAEGRGRPEAERARRHGLLIVYTGHGKGKTTAALGTVMRALGRGMRVAVVQFIKGKWKTGERVFAEGLRGLEFHVMGLGFTWESDDISRDRAAAAAAWSVAKGFIESGERDLVVLDEITYAFHYGFISLDEVVAALRSRPPRVHVIVTGRNAPEALTEAADLVTEMRALKHPYERGVPAQLGIDF